MITLPVNLVDFNGKTDGGKNILTWVCTTETNNSRFEIERSSNGIVFEKIGIVPGKGTSASQQNYSYIDQYAHPATSYYRLKQIDNDGSFFYSSVIVLKSTVSQTLQVSPNPFSDKLFVEIANMSGSKPNGLQFMDITGRVYFLKTSYTSNGVLFNTEQLPGSIYIVQWNNEGKVYQTKVIKKRRT